MTEAPQKRPITEVIAENLAYWMQQHPTLNTQSALGAAAGVAQTTIGNYLNPTQRLQGAKGKPPSPKVVELDRIADALGIGVWLLIRPMSPVEREYFQKMDMAAAALMAQSRSAVPTQGRRRDDQGDGDMEGGRSNFSDLDEAPTTKPARARGNT